MTGQKLQTEMNSRLGGWFGGAGHCGWIPIAKRIAGDHGVRVNGRRTTEARTSKTGFQIRLELLAVPRRRSTHDADKLVRANSQSSGSFVSNNIQLTALDLFGCGEIGS